MVIQVNFETPRAKPTRRRPKACLILILLIVINLERSPIPNLQYRSHVLDCHLPKVYGRIDEECHDSSQRTVALSILLMSANHRANRFKPGNQLSVHCSLPDGIGSPTPRPSTLLQPSQFLSAMADSPHSSDLCLLSSEAYVHHDCTAKRSPAHPLQNH